MATRSPPIRERKLSVRDAIKIEYGGHEAKVKKALVGFRDRFHVEVEHGEDLRVKGNIVDHEYEIERDGDKIAEVSKKWLRVRDTYGVEVLDEADSVLVLSVTVAVDAPRPRLRTPRPSSTAGRGSWVDGTATRGHDRRDPDGRCGEGHRAGWGARSTSFSDAVKSAVATASQTIRNITVSTSSRATRRSRTARSRSTRCRSRSCSWPTRPPVCS